MANRNMDMSGPQLADLYEKKFEELKKSHNLVAEKNIVKPVSFRQYMGTITKVYKWTHDITEDKRGLVLNPEKDKKVASQYQFRWGWLADAELVSKNVSAALSAEHKKQERASVFSHLSLMCRDILRKPSLLAAVPGYVSPATDASKQASEQRDNQIAPEAIKESMPLPHEILQNQVKIMEYAMNLKPIINGIREEKDAKGLKDVYAKVHNLLYGNLITQIYSFSEERIFRSENFYKLEIYVKGGKTPEPRPNEIRNYVIIDPKNRSAPLEFVYYDFKTSGKFQNYVYPKSSRYAGQKFTDIGFRFRIAGNDAPAVAFWLTWDLEPDRPYFLVQTRDNTKPVSGTNLTKWIAEHTWYINNTKTPGPREWRAAKMNIQRLNERFISQKRINELIAQSFQVTGVARTSYYFPELMPVIGASYRLYTAYPDEKAPDGKPFVLMHHTGKHAGHFKTDAASQAEISKFMGIIGNDTHSRVLDWDHTFKPPLITAEEVMEKYEKAMKVPMDVEEIDTTVKWDKIRLELSKEEHIANMEVEDPENPIAVMDVPEAVVTDISANKRPREEQEEEEDDVRQVFNEM